MPTYLGKKGQGYTQQIGYCQRCGWKYLRTELTEDDYIKGLLVCVYCHDPDQPQRYPVEPRAEGFPPLVPAPDQYPGPLAPVLTGSYDNVDTVDLAWTPSFDNADLINQYFIWRQTNGGPAVLIASVPFEDTYDFPNNQAEPYTSPTVYADDTVVPNTNYAYYVVAEAVDHRLSPQSNVFSIFTQPPPAVLAGFYNYTTNAVDLSWKMPGSWGSSVQHYVLYRSVNGGAFSQLAIFSGGTLSYNDTTANSFLNIYEYYVVAEFVGGNSLPSDIVIAPVVVTQIYNGPISTAWIKPASAVFVAITVMGPGGPGVSPSNGEGGYVAGPGGGGYISATYHASAIPSTVSVVAGGPGIAGPSAGASGPANLGTAGGNSLFTGFLQANAGAVANLVAGGAGGVATLLSSTGIFGSATIEQGGNGGNSNESFPDPDGIGTTYAGPGGAGGGRASPQNSGLPGPAGGNGGTCANGGAGGNGGAGSINTGFPGSSGTAAPAGKIFGGGGGGGGGAPDHSHSPGGAGGLGGGYASGGGSGGSCGDGGGIGFTGGQGGNGGPGVVAVTSYS